MAGMNFDVWDVTDTIQQLIRSRAAVDDKRLTDPDVPLTARAAEARGVVCSKLSPRHAWPALLDRDEGDEEADQRIEPPRADGRVGGETDEHRRGLDAAEDVLGSLASRSRWSRGGRRAGAWPCRAAASGPRSWPVRTMPITVTSAWPPSSSVRVLSTRDVGGEDEELHGDELLRARLRRIRKPARAGEAPHDHG